MPLLGSLIKRFIKARSMVKLRRGSALAKQKRVLRKLIRKAEFTEFGKHFHFTQILSAESIIERFRSIVHTYNYNSIYKEWWHRNILEEENICWPGKTKYFALSSGTSDSASKHIPVTNDMIHAIQRGSIRQILSLANYDLQADTFEKGILMLGGSTKLDRKGRYYEGDLSGISAAKLPFWFQHFYKPGKKISEEKDWEKKLDEIAELAPQWDVAFVVGVPAWIQIMIERIIARHKLKNIHEVWPNLICYVHGGVSFEPYRRSFEKLFAQPMAYVDSYLASEGFIAFQTNPNTKAMKLITDNGIFFEFVPFDENNFDANGELLSTAKALHIGEVKENIPYALLMSTCAGAWRYLIGDVVKFTSLKETEIVIVGRTKHYLSLCGEHLSVENMNQAIEMCAEKFNVSLREFCVTGIPHSKMFAHHWYVGCDEKVNAEEFRAALDNNLKKVNDDYAVERIAALNEVIVDIIPTNLFYKWMEQHGKSGGQNKFPRVMKGSQYEDWKQFVETEMKTVN
ncbi:hypothetical protein LBMAG27_09430 [Bacteroidota bacterium]|nr:hypothetical protein LBMAG27_09430 [Bacteroidota bacterium]